MSTLLKRTPLKCMKCCNFSRRSRYLAIYHYKIKQTPLDFCLNHSVPIFLSVCCCLFPLCNLLIRCKISPALLSAQTAALACLARNLCMSSCAFSVFLQAHPALNLRPLLSPEALDNIALNHPLLLLWHIAPPCVDKIQQMMYYIFELQRLLYRIEVKKYQKSINKNKLKNKLKEKKNEKIIFISCVHSCDCNNVIVKCLHSLCFGNQRL